MGTLFVFAITLLVVIRF